MDSHDPEGHLSKSCAQRGYSDFDGVIACTAQDVAGFVHFVQASGYLANTNIVIIGDHLARKNPLSGQLGRLSQRTIFNAFIGAGTPARNREQLVHFDLLPTILEFSGFTVAGGRLGLGYSAFNHHRAHPEAQRLADMQASLMNRSDAYLALWTGQAHQGAHCHVRRARAMQDGVKRRDLRLVFGVAVDAAEAVGAGQDALDDVVGHAVLAQVGLGARGAAHGFVAQANVDDPSHLLVGATGHRGERFWLRIHGQDRRRW